jgi:hypothetical protein
MKTTTTSGCHRRSDRRACAIQSMTSDLEIPAAYKTSVRTRADPRRIDVRLEATFSIRESPIARTERRRPRGRTRSGRSAVTSAPTTRTVHAPGRGALRRTVATRGPSRARLQRPRPAPGSMQTFTCDSARRSRSANRTLTRSPARGERGIVRNSTRAARAAGPPSGSAGGAAAAGDARAALPSSPSSG